MAKLSIKLAAALSYILLTACSGPQHRANVNSPEMILPPFPTDKTTSSVSLIRTGVETLARSKQAMEADTDLYLPLYNDGLQWATYQIPTGPRPLQAAVRVDAEATSEYWIGLADFKASNWELSGPYSENTELPLATSNHRSPAGNVYLAVIAMATQRVQIKQVSVLDRMPPVAVIDYSGWSYTNKSQPQYFDALKSYARDGALVKYEWDLDGDGTFEVEQATPERVTSMVPQPPGRLMMRLRVTDDAGFTAEDQIPITNSVQWVDFTLGGDDQDAPDLIAGLAMINGVPSVCWEENRFAYAVPYNIRYRRLDGVQDRLVAQSEYDSGAPAFAVINGLPTVVYSEYEWGMNESWLWHCQATDTAGTAWQPTQIAYTSENIQGEATFRSLGERSLAEVAGHPALLYGVGDDHYPYYLRSSDPAGTLWPEGIDLDVNGVDWRGNSLLSFQGNPFAAFRLIYLTGSNAFGSEWSNPERAGPFFAGWGQITSYGDQLFAIKIETLDSWYEDHATESSFFKWEQGVEDWSEPVPIHKGTNFNACLAIIDGRPWYFWTGDNKLYLLKALNPEGSVWAPVELIDVANEYMDYQMQVSAIDTGQSAGVAWTSCDSYSFIGRSELYYDELPY